MAWQGILGHDHVVEQFRRALARGRLASTFLFTGPAGVGKRAFAERLAQALLCTETPEARLEPCGACASCNMVAARTHPDLNIVEKPPDKSAIPLAAFIGDDEHRMREGLCHDIALKPYLGGRKVAIVDDADFLNEEGANALLKTLEEPPPKSVLILIGTSPDRQLPTIRSRSQLVRFRPLEVQDLAQVLLDRGLVDGVEGAETFPARALALASRADGSVARALEVADEDLWAFRGALLAQLGRGSFDSVGLAREVLAFVESAGKEAPARRARARQVIGFAVEFYRHLLRALAGESGTAEASLHRAVDQASAAGRLDALAAVACTERSLAALAHVDRNAHQAALLECWLDELAQVIETGYLAEGVAE